MCIDIPRIDYKKSGKKKITQKDYDESVRLNMESIERMKKRKKELESAKTH